MFKPRIALLHYASPPTIGGVESTIASQSRLLSGVGYETQVVTGRGECFEPSVPVAVIPELSSSHPRVEQVQRELAAGEVSTEFHQLSAELTSSLGAALKVDVCVAHNLATLHKNMPATAALYNLVEQGQLRLVAWSHDFAWTEPVYRQDLHPGFPWDLLRRPWPGVRYVVVSASRRQELGSLLGIESGEIDVIPPGIDPLEFLGIVSAVRSWVSELDLLQADPLLLLPARVTRRKNIELGIRITAALKELGLCPLLLVMGPLGPHNPANKSYLEELRELQRRLNAEDCVLFLQAGGLPVDDPARRDLYLLADALLFPSQREGFGIPLLEAGLARLPIFCADIDPFHESAGRDACYFGLEESANYIARRIARILSEDARYRWKRRVLREYSWNTILERTEALLKEVIARE